MDLRRFPKVVIEGSGTLALALVPQRAGAFGHDFASNAVREESDTIVVCNQICCERSKDIFVESDEIFTVAGCTGEKSEWRRVQEREYAIGHV